MAIKNIVIGQTGQDGQKPQWIIIDTDDTITAVTTAGYLNKAKQQGYAFSEYQMALVSTKTSPSSVDVQLAELQVSYTSPNWSLVPASGPGAVTLPTIANHIATYTNTIGGLSEDPATAINGGNIQAGLSGIPGYLSSFPAAAARGSLRFVAANNAGDTVTQITNASFAQATVLTIPDPVLSAASFPLSTTGILEKTVVGASAAGGSAAQSFTDTFCTSGCVVVGNWVTQANAASVLTIVPGNGSFIVTSSADAGAGTFSYTIRKPI